MQQDRESQVRQRAHAIWVEEGMPEGLSEHHWSRAESEFAADEAYATITPLSATAQSHDAPAADAISTVEPESAATVEPVAVPDTTPAPEPVAAKKATRRKVKPVMPVR